MMTRQQKQKINATLSLGLGKVTIHHYNKPFGLGHKKRLNGYCSVSDANRTKKQFNSVEIISVSYAMGGIYL